MSPLHRTAPLVLALGLLAACGDACSTSAASRSKKHDAGSGLLPDGGQSTLPDGGSTFAGTLVISPRDTTVDVTPGQAIPSVTFTAAGNGSPVTPAWSASPSTLGSIDASGRYMPSGAVGGVASISASLGSARDSTSLTVRLHLTQNGAIDAGSTDDGGSTGVGGIGGVGGEGVGGPVDGATAAVLQSAPTADPGLALLYPYDGTVWPKDLLAPLLQWANGAHVPEAVAIHLECPAFSWDGMFAQTATPFVHHPVPQAAWTQMSEACARQTVQVRLVFASGGAAYGPLTQSWRMSSGTLKGVVYYNSYGSKLAYNYSGALPNGGPFGGATLAIRGGSTDPVLVAGKSGSTSDCRVCHVVSADGSTLLSQHGDSYPTTSSYALRSGNTETTMSPGDGTFAWGGINPDGTLLLSNSAPIIAASSADSALYQVPTGTPVAATGLPPGLRAGTPVFSPDGAHVAFNWYGGDAAGASGDQRTLAMMTFGVPANFSEFTPLYTPPSGQTALYPSFFPTGTGIVFETETQSNGRGFGETRSTCDGSGSCSDVGSHGELWWVDIASKQAHRLDVANGLGVAPTGPSGHDDDSTLNYEPTVSPIPSGGYAWVIFTSRRLYGNVATINPFWSDPRFHDISQTPTTKKLWVAAIDLSPTPGTDPSHPAFYLPAQELLAGNSRGYWSLTPCLSDGKSCASGDECCGGYCRSASSELGPVCGSVGGGCSKEYEKCTTASECCDLGSTCVNNRCVGIPFR